MKKPEHAYQLLSMAEKDLNALKGMRDEEVFADEIFGFHAQQLVEKTLKAWLDLLGVKYPFVHDIRVLLNALEGKGEDVSTFWDFVDLSAFAGQIRYQGYDSSDDTLDRSEIIIRTEELLRKVQSHAHG